MTLASGPRGRRRERMRDTTRVELTYAVASIVYAMMHPGMIHDAVDRFVDRGEGNEVVRASERVDGGRISPSSVRRRLRRRKVQGWWDEQWVYMADTLDAPRCITDPASSRGTPRRSTRVRDVTRHDNRGQTPRKTVFVLPLPDLAYSWASQHHPSAPLLYAGNHLRTVAAKDASTDVGERALGSSRHTDTSPAGEWNGHGAQG
ncbi:hypothetical protein C8R46DRAFT_1046880 [Mycena filopes]|nr:hypothetical protein C8R46DRAFT_1046880 [Mycena filopes]